MQDLDEVRQALGYEQINLIGASYGSRAAQRYMALYPENVRSVVLSAVVSHELVLQLQAPVDGQRALALFLERCREDEACRDAFPDFANTFANVREALGQGQEVTFEHPVSGERETLMLDEEEWMQGIFSLLYSPELVSLLPLMVQDIAQTGDYGPLLAQIVALTEDVINYHGMFYAVACSEDAEQIDLQAARELQEGSSFPLVADDLVTRCENWPRAEITPSFREPLQSDIPTLLLSGEADPITPPHYAAQVAEGLDNSLSLTLPDFGHDVLLAGCVPALVTRFIESGTVQDLQIECVDEIVPPAFFVSPAGPKP
jgi:pimeloyl-ACP methyl ester carboxylesterase